MTTMQQVEIYTWQIGPSIYRAMPEAGARLMSWDLQLAGGEERSVIYWPDEADLSQAAKIRGGNPILFPFVARTFHKGLENKWKSPSGDVLPMPRHGFCRDGEFRVDELDEKGFRASFLPSEETKAAYPFEYDFRVIYRFSELDFQVTLDLENKGDVPIPWCAGHHFYFTIPWHKGLKREDYRINIEAKKAFNHGSDGRLIPLEKIEGENNLNNEDLVDRIHSKLKSNRVSFGPKGGEEDITIEIGEDKIPTTWSSLTTWTEDLKKSPFYCVEPWMGPPNAVEHKKGLHVVSPGEIERYRVKVSLQ